MNWVIAMLLGIVSMASASCSETPVARGGKDANMTRVNDAPRAETDNNENAKADGPAASVENSLGMKFVLIPSGKFTMGSPVSETGGDDEHEGNEMQVEVTLTKPFYMGTTTVTQGQWKLLMKTEPWKGQGASA